ncbi:hypothetical protein CY34DRAFT_798082 [Suillus luteus UH-Slu-Lm8-n1]|uniref:Uncharacterized protein n=1 Tax=Suillus luteus UH-Slu-Lm8-n1 TaxID=930992 RepID=A0A0D0AEB6_9AGAM|nr:hypothetical protein CY34DRAFT_798082 [Suillus luteus UH-Slu-Lm8-n1]
MGAIIIEGMAYPNVLLNLMVRAVVACWGYYMWPSHTAPAAPSYPDRAARLASLFSEQDNVCLSSNKHIHLTPTRHTTILTSSSVPRRSASCESITRLRLFL